jgi:hypothetical protein
MIHLQQCKRAESITLSKGLLLPTRSQKVDFYNVSGLPQIKHLHISENKKALHSCSLFKASMQRRIMFR